MKSLMQAGAFALVLAASAAPMAMAQQAPSAADAMFRATTINLSAYGETEIAPDMATISLGVMTEGATAAEAMQANATKMSQVMAALRKGGLPERDIQTSSLNLSPRYRYEDNKPPILTGYQASNQVTITVRDLKRLGPAVDASVGAGANQVNGISFGLADSTAAENAARQKAVKALAAKADLYAQATGHRVSRLINLSEGGASYPNPPMPMMVKAFAQREMADTPVSPGEVKIRVDVSAVYELTR